MSKVVFEEIKIPSSQYINDSSKEYSLYVLETRGIPSVWDGLKDGQRKALYVLQNRSGEIKTISLAGEMISRNIYLHGDTAAADSIGKLAAPYQNNYPIIKGIGSFGTRTVPGSIAAPRYTYVKKNNITENIFFSDADIVPMMDNYDNSTQSPKNYIPLIPTVLMNGIEGMAPGFSTKILPRDIYDIIQATLDVLNFKVPTTLSPKFSFCKGSVKNEGPNKWAFYGDLEILDSSTILITELPPTMNHENFIERLIKLEDDKEIREYEDNTKDKTNILVKLPRGMCKDWTKDDALSYFNLCYRDTERLVVIDWDGKTVKQYESPEDLTISYVSERFKYYEVRYIKLLSEANVDCAFWTLIKECYDANLPGLIRSFESKNELVQFINKVQVQKNLNCTSEQIERIAQLPTYRWTKEEYIKVQEKIKSLQEKIQEYVNLVKNPDLRFDVYRKEVQELLTIKFEVDR